MARPMPPVSLEAKERHCPALTGSLLSGGEDKKQARDDGHRPKRQGGIKDGRHREEQEHKGMILSLPDWRREYPSHHHRKYLFSVDLFVLWLFFYPTFYPTFSFATWPLEVVPFPEG